MKKERNIIILLFVLTFCWADGVFAQYISRGHNHDDLYFQGMINAQYQYALIRCTDYGANIQVMDSVDVYNTDSLPVTIFQHPVADIAEGYVYTADRNYYPALVSVSNDYGENWLHPVNGPQLCREITGGEQAGEGYVLSDDHMLYYTNDNFQTFTLTNSGQYLHSIETGTEDGELYAISNYSKLLHSLDHGASFEVINVDTAVIGPNHNFALLSRGAFAGDLYIYSWYWDYLAQTEKHEIFHSLDYGHNFTRIYEKTGLDGLTFTAGRDSCSLFFFRFEWNGGTPINWIDYTSDCCQSFTNYEYTFTDIADMGAVARGHMNITPNPAHGRIELKYTLNKSGTAGIEVFSMIGKKVLSAVNEQKQAGAYQQWMDVSGLEPGVYVVSLILDGVNLTTQKLVIQ